MTGGDADCRAFRAEIDRLYPALSARIALARGELADDPAAFATDLRAQLPPAILDATAHRIESYQRLIAHEYRTARILRNPVGNMCVSLFADIDPAAPVRRRGVNDDPLARYLPPAGDAAACYVIVSRALDPRTQMQRLSDRSVHPLRMKFAQAALDPRHMKWWSFYHELSHALIALGHHDTGRKTGPALRRIYAMEMEESICDAYASLMTARRFGPACLPMLRTMADMRRSLFPLSGPHYYTAPALDAVIADLRDGRVPAPGDEFAHAFETAQKSFLPYDDFAAGFLRLKEEENRIFMALTPRVKARLTATVSACYAGSEWPEAARHDTHRAAARRLAEGAAVIERDYKNSLPAAIIETGWRWARYPLYRAGVLRHPGY